ncbi:MotA/TolQ/ExbB proton channel family protein [Halobacteriovorax sp.]|uniref:MotA/TolQ/ExbB proton channel family protein n=1 Tax=Halobacteriovorax sp. TaxID=2020862 RepID=UPI003AF28594
MLNPGNRRLLDLLDYTPKRKRVNWTTVGGGIRGIILLIFFFALGALLASINEYFFSITALVIGILLYNLDSHIFIFFERISAGVLKNAHITPNATQLIEFNNTMDAVEHDYYLNNMSQLNDFDSLINKSSLSSHLVYESKEDFDTIENTFENIIYNDTHEIYTFFISVLDTIAGITPLIGLIGTVFGIVQVLKSMGGSVDDSMITAGMALAMKTTLYGAIYSALFKILSMRLKIKRDALDYDFERCKNHLHFIVNKRKSRDV